LITFVFRSLIRGRWVISRVNVCALVFGKGPDMSEKVNQPRVFVVDDEEIIASTVAMILRQQGFDATAFSNPLEALRAARSDAPDLLISDVVMPDLSGIDLAIQLRDFCPNCQILLFSGQASTGYMLEKARDSGHDFELMSKPIHPTDLLKKVRIATAAGPVSTAQGRSRS